MRFLIVFAVSLVQASWVFAQGVQVPIPQDALQDETSDGVKYIEQLLEGYAYEGSPAIYDPDSPEAQLEFCKNRLIYAERSLAKLLSDFGYTASISVKGAAPYNLGVECNLSSTRQANIVIEGPTD